MQYHANEERALILKEALRQTELKFQATDEIAKLHDQRFFQIGAVLFVIVGFLVRVQPEAITDFFINIYCFVLCGLGFYAFIQNAPRKFDSLGHYWQSRTGNDNDDYWRATFLARNPSFEKALIDQVTTNTTQIFNNESINLSRGFKYKAILWIWLAWSVLCLCIIGALTLCYHN